MVKILDSHYHFIGSDDGRVLQYYAKDKSFISRLFSFQYIKNNSSTLSHKNKVYALALHEEILCASGYGGEIILIDIFTRTTKKHLLHSTSSVCSLTFLDKKTLVASNVNGEIYIYNLQTQTHKKYTTTKRDILGVLHIQKEGILLVYSSDNYLTLIDLKTERLLAQKFILFPTIVQDIYIKKESIFIILKDETQIALSLSEILLKLELLRDDFAKKASRGYITKIQKEIQSPFIEKEKGESFQILEDAYKKNNFTKCYEIMDTYELSGTQLCELLSKYWKKIFLECEIFALQGNAQQILFTLGELLFIKSRSDILGDLLRLSFFKKIENLYKEKLYSSAQNIIYSYIDIFGYDCEISQIIKEFERVSQKTIAILNHKEDRKSRDFWKSYFHQTY